MTKQLMLYSPTEETGLIESLKRIVTHRESYASATQAGQAKRFGEVLHGLEFCYYYLAEITDFSVSATDL